MCRWMAALLPSVSRWVILKWDGLSIRDPPHVADGLKGAPTGIGSALLYAHISDKYRVNSTRHQFLIQLNPG